MPVLVGLVTYLALSGTPGLPETFTAKSEDTGAKGSATGITGLMLTGVPGRSYGTFDAKSAATADSRSVTDTYLVRLQLGDVSAVSTELTDRYVLQLTFSGYSSDTRVPADRYVPRLAMGIAAIDKAGTIARAGSDSYVPVLTFSVPTASYNSAVADSYVPVLTLGLTVTSSDALELADSYVPVLGMSYLVQSIVYRVDRAVIDSYVPVLTFGSTLLEAGEVDAIRIEERPFYLIRIEEA
jgi:hypothetical protein